MNTSKATPTTNQMPTVSRFSAGAWLGFGLPVTFAGHAATMFAVYASGVGSELGFFALPFAAAFSGYYFILLRSQVTHTSRVARSAIAFVLACVSCVVGMSWSFTTFGT